MAQPASFNMSKAQLIEAHKVLERYHRLKAENAALDLVHERHETLADLLRDEIASLELQEKKDV